MPRPERYVSRSDLGWPKSGAAYANPKSGLVVHYDGTNQRLADRECEECFRYWRNTRIFHTGPSRGWADIGYSFGACPHGRVFEGRGLFKTQAAQPGGNTTYYSVSLMCGPNDRITDAQINAVRQLREWLMEPSTSIRGTVKGHRDFVATSCPGDRLYRMVRDGVFSKPAVWGGKAPKPATPTPSKKGTVPGPRHPFPLPSGYYFGPKSGPDKSVSGYYKRVFKGRTDREWLREFGAQLARRGWGVGKGKRYLTRYGNDGIYGSEYRALVEAFQRDQGLPVNGRVDKRTWDQAFLKPVT